MPAAQAVLKPDAANKDYAIGLARAFGGAIIFGFPLLMTMEMWWLGFYMDRERLLLFFLLNLALLVGLSHFVGFEETNDRWDDVMDAFAAYGVGVLASAALLALLGILTPDMPADEILGKIAVQSIPASIGAVVARGQMGGGDIKNHGIQDEKERSAGYWGQIFLMLAGALFLAFNVAPTEEMILIAFMMTPWHAVGLVLLSIALLHAFVYAIGFRGQEQMPEGAGHAGSLLHFTLVGYAIALLVSLYVLWTFGRTDGASLASVVMMTVVLGFPSALGAASARLVI